MSQKERDWLHWLTRVQEGEITQRQAAEWMEVSERWVRELVRRYELYLAGDCRTQGGVPVE